MTRDTVKPARERASTATRTTSRGSEVSSAGSAVKSGGRPSRATPVNPARRRPEEREDAPGAARPARGARAGGSAKTDGVRKAGAGKAGAGQAGTAKPGSSRSTSGAAKPASGGSRAGGTGGRKAPPKVGARGGMPELKRVKLDAPPPATLFVDRDGERVSFADSNLKRVAAQVLSEKRKAWRYRPFSFPLFTDRGHEQAFHFDFYVYDAEDSVIRLILVVPFESREVWDRVGRFKRQYPMYTYELWTPEKLAQLSGPRGRLDF